jgi:hypothetical protein
MGPNASNTRIGPQSRPDLALDAMVIVLAARPLRCFAGRTPSWRAAIQVSTPSPMASFVPIGLSLISVTALPRRTLGFSLASE